MRRIISPQWNLTLLLTWVHGLFPCLSLVYLRNLMGSSAFPEQQTVFLTGTGQKRCKSRAVTEKHGFPPCGLSTLIWTNLAVCGWERALQWLDLVSLCFSEHQNNTQVTPSDNPCRRTCNCCDLLVSSNWVTDPLWLQCYPFSTLNNLGVIFVLDCNKAAAFWSLRWMMWLYIEAESHKWSQGVTMLYCTDVLQ